jgi:hypothetical protein
MSHRTDKPTEQVLTSDDIASLRDEVRLLRQVLDELREELSWANNNAIDPLSQVRPVRITSMSLDPTSPDFQVNTVDEATIARLRDEHASTQSSQRSLF